MLASEAWDEVKTDSESEDSDRSMESEEDVAAQEYFDDTSDDAVPKHFSWAEKDHLHQGSPLASRI